MPLTLDEYGDGIGAAWTVLNEHTLRTAPDAAVVTCPGWAMRDLVAHLGMVHRWAAATVRGERVDTDTVEREGLTAADQRGWLDAGAKDLLQALVDAPDDLDVFFFLPDAPPAKLAWARRQCHETTIHAVDAMSASLGRPPRTDETWIRPRFAVDGIDELVTGFVPRPNQRLRSATPLTVLVEAVDTGDSWTMQIGDDPVVTTRGTDAAADAVLSGTAAGLYLTLWNRGDEVEASGEDVLSRWHELVRVAWV